MDKRLQVIQKINELEDQYYKGTIIHDLRLNHFASNCWDGILTIEESAFFSIPYIEGFPRKLNFSDDQYFYQCTYSDHKVKHIYGVRSKLNKI